MWRADPRPCRRGAFRAKARAHRRPAAGAAATIRGWRSTMSFRGVFIAIFLGTALVLAAFMINSRRPRQDTSQPTAEFIRATGKCAECHRRETSAVVHEYEMSRHNATGINCLQCHQPVDGQPAMDHRGFSITKTVTAANCKQCHQTEYQQ